MTASIPLLLERDNVNDESVVLLRWHVKHGERVEANALLAEIETSKANMEVFSPESGFLVWNFPEGANIPVSSPIGYIAEVAPVSSPEFKPVSSQQTPIGLPLEPNATKAVAVPGSAQIAAEVPVPSASDVKLPVSTPYRQRFSPVATKMMVVHALKPADFANKSIIRKQDILDFLNPSTPSLQPVAPGRPAAPTAKITQPYKEISLTKMKRREAQSLATGLQNAIQSAVSVTCFTQGMRGKLRASIAGINVTAVIIYEVSRLLRKFPTFNATYRDGTMLQFSDVNLGYAMDDGRGLKVAVFQNCDTLSLAQISALLSDLTVAYIEDKLTPSQIANATFTISDLSSMGISSFYPLLSENQGGILGVGADQFPPDSAYGSYNLTLAFDHQLSDGRTAALFLNDLKQRLQKYESTLQEVRKVIACSQCGRTAEQLAEINANLMLSALPKGYICNFCMSGW